MVQDNSDSFQEESHSLNQPLHIIFHNPNTVEETAKFLAKLIAKVKGGQFNENN